MPVHELVATEHIHWAHASTDISKLRAVLLQPAHYKGLTPYEQRACSSYALTHEELHDGEIRQVVCIFWLLLMKGTYMHRHL